MTLAIGVR